MQLAMRGNKTTNLATMKKRLDYPQGRNHRCVNIAQLQTPFDKTDKIPVGILYHKSGSGHRLFSLNKRNIPIQCWSDITAHSTIPCSIVKTATFQNIVARLNPAVAFLNDGEYITTRDLKNTKVYSCSLSEILKSIEIANTDISESPQITFSEMKALDPSLTKREYFKILNIK